MSISAFPLRTAEMSILLRREKSSSKMKKARFSRMWEESLLLMKNEPLQDKRLWIIFQSTISVEIHFLRRCGNMCQIGSASSIVLVMRQGTRCLHTFRRLSIILNKMPDLRDSSILGNDSWSGLRPKILPRNLR